MRIMLLALLSAAIVSCGIEGFDDEQEGPAGVGKGGMTGAGGLVTPRPLATPRPLVTPTGLAEPRGLGTPHDLATHRELGTPRGLATPRLLSTPRELATPQSLTVSGQGDPAKTEEREETGSGTLTAQVVAEGLEVPWAMAFAPDGRILVTERAGRIRVVEEGSLLDEPFATLDVTAVSESGLMGIALHPEFEDNGYVYVCYTYRAGRSLVNRVARLTEVDGRGTDHRVILDGIPGARNHNGCAGKFGPDAHLYITTGDAQEPDLAQDLDSLAGKVLRLNPDGSVPADNPFPGSPVYTYGHRNPQGLDWHPVTGELFITEHGPRSDDELNILEPGGNYGWPGALGLVNDSRYVDPILALTPTVALSGAAFYTGDTLPEEWRGDFFFATLRATHLHRVVLKGPDFREVESHERLFDGQFGRLRAVGMGPDGHLYVTTSNRDGRGRPKTGDDKLLRLVWKQ